jgi:Domain of unknown function (DUF1707)
MVGPGDEMTRTGGGARLRASHADREQVIDTLKAAFVHGLLDRDEFDLRAGHALDSRTCADLAAITADIPAGLAAAQPPEPARPQGQQPVLRPGPVMVAATVSCAGVWELAFLITRGADNQVAGFLVLMATLTYFAIMALAGAQILVLRQERHGERPSGGGRASRHRPSDGPASQPPPTGPGQQHTAEAAQSRPFRRSHDGAHGHDPAGGPARARRGARRTIGDPAGA